MPANVVLIGFMGAGKSAVGTALAERLGWQLYDTDSMVEADAGASIASIWESGGEEAFRTHEHRAILRACAGERRVIACGGGGIVALRNYGILRGAGRIVFLRASRDTLRARVKGDTTRPLLADPTGFDRLLAERTPVYEAAADDIVDVDGRTPEEIALEIEGLLS